MEVNGCSQLFGYQKSLKSIILCSAKKEEKKTQKIQVWNNLGVSK